MGAGYSKPVDGGSSPAYATGATGQQVNTQTTEELAASFLPLEGKKDKRSSSGTAVQTTETSGPVADRPTPKILVPPDSPWFANTEAAEMVVTVGLVIAVFWSVMGGNLTLSALLCFLAGVKGWLMYKKYPQRIEELKTICQKLKTV